MIVGDWDQEEPELRHDDYNPRPRKLDSAEGERQIVLRDLIAYDVWDERLLSDMLFGKTYQTVLSPRERFVLDMLIDGKSEKYIVKVLRLKSPQRTFDFNSLSSMKSAIKRKFRDGYNKDLPGWIRGKAWDKELIDE